MTWRKLEGKVTAKDVYRPFNGKRVEDFTQKLERLQKAIEEVDENQATKLCYKEVAMHLMWQGLESVDMIEYLQKEDVEQMTFKPAPKPVMARIVLAWSTKAEQKRQMEKVLAEHARHAHVKRLRDIAENCQIIASEQQVVKLAKSVGMDEKEQKVALSQNDGDLAKLGVDMKVKPRRLFQQFEMVADKTALQKRLQFRAYA